MVPDSWYWNVAVGPGIQRYDDAAAAGAIVTKDVPAYTIVAGNPARIVKRRFPEDVAGRLSELAWWDWDHETLRRALPDFRKLAVEDFLDKYATAGRTQTRQRSVVS